MECPATSDESRGAGACNAPLRLACALIATDLAVPDAQRRVPTNALQRMRVKDPSLDARNDSLDARADGFRGALHWNVRPRPTDVAVPGACNAPLRLASG